MAREYTQKFITHQIIELLDKLIDTGTNSIEYRSIMYKLGTVLGEIILAQTKDKKITLACTVEDADFLAKGIIDVLESDDRKVFLTVFWNKRLTPNAENKLTVAPIIKEFHEHINVPTHTLLIIKSIIANSCVVRTNLTRLIEESNPEDIFVIAPVLLEGAITKLSKEFESSISDKFKYIYFAVDSEKTEDGMVVPGIGGDVYQRLGFQGQEQKNSYTPTIVKERRHNYI